MMNGELYISWHVEALSVVEGSSAGISAAQVARDTLDSHFRSCILQALLPSLAEPHCYAPQKQSGVLTLSVLF